MVGRTYLERGQPVVVLARWATGNRGVGGGYSRIIRMHELGYRRHDRTCPRNVLIRRADGSRVVRPFRGLRRPKEI